MPETPWAAVALGAWIVVMGIACAWVFSRALLDCLSRFGAALLGRRPDE